MSSMSPANVSELFQANEEDIFDALSSTDLPSLSKELFENVVITKRAHETFNSLDHDRLNSRTRARYLLSLIIDRMQQNHNTYPQLYKVLSRRVGACMELATCLNQKMVPPDCQKNLLHECDLENLLKCIIDCSPKWEELGTMLGLPQRALENCKMEGSVELKLKKVLLEWLTGRYKNARNCTLKTLKEALESPAVAYPCLSSGLEEALQIQHRPKLGNDITSYSETVTGPIITYQSSDTEVADHKSTILEVQVRKSSEPISYQWMRNGQPLSDTLPFSGTTTAMLLINQASLGAEGVYSCQVRCGQQLTETSPVILQVMYPKYKKILVSQYSKYDIPQNSWPLSNCNVFVDLILIKNSKIKKPSHFVIEQEMEALLVEQEKINYDSAFGEHKTGTVILVEGRPGSGKTTLAHRIVKDWSQGKALKYADHVFLISLRRHPTRSQIFESCYHSLSQKYMEDIEESGGDKACFVLDGYDEYNPKEDKNDSVIEDILNKKYLPESMVIITSRPEATVDLRQKTDMRIEILGFTKEQFEFYVDNYPFETSSDPKEEKEIRTKLQDYVKNCTNVLNICYLPINASIICFLFSQHLGEIPPPKTESQIYEKLVTAIALRQLRLQDSAAQLRSLRDLRRQDMVIFREICSLALQMTFKNKQIFHKLPESLTSLKKSLFRELFVIDHTIKLYGIEEVFSFVHLTLQEYLAAYHLASLGSDRWTPLLATQHHMSTTIKFYCGLIDGQTKRDQLPHLFLAIHMGRNVLHMIHCAYETQEHEHCRTALDTLDGEIHIVNTTLTPADFTALSYVISAAPHKVTRFSFIGCRLYEDCFNDLIKVRSLNLRKLFDHGMESLVTGFSDIYSLIKMIPLMRVSYKVNQSCLQVLEMLKEKEDFVNEYRNTTTDYVAAANKMKKICDITVEATVLNSSQMIIFKNFLSKCTKLQKLQLTHFVCLANASTTAKPLNYVACLNELSISNITSSNMITLGEMLQYCKNLQRFRLADSHCHQEGSIALSEGLKQCKLLQHLNILDTRLGSEGVIALAQSLKYIPLKELVAFVGCDIGHEGIVALAREGCFKQAKELSIIHDNAKSETLPFLIQNMSPHICFLQLTDNQIDSVHMATLVEKLNSCSAFESLDLSFNQIGPEGAAALGNSLKNCTQFHLLNIAGCKITSDGIPALVRGFRNWSKLSLLDLTDNRLCSKAMAPLSEQFKYLPSLECLYFSHNDIDYRGAIALARGIQKCSSIRVFNISHNNIGSIGAAAIASALKCHKMDFVNFSNNSIDLENELLGIHLVALAKRGKLRLSDLSQNQVGNDTTIRLIICLIFNLQILNISTNNTPPEIVEFVTAFRKITTSAKFPKIYISN